MDTILNFASAGKSGIVLRRAKVPCLAHAQRSGLRPRRPRMKTLAAMELWGVGVLLLGHMRDAPKDQEKSGSRRLASKPLSRFGLFGGDEGI